MRVRAAIMVLLLATTGRAADRIPVVIDTDIGADIDDAFALALALASPELEVVGVTTIGGGNQFDPFVGQRKDRDDHRAWLVCRFLTLAGAKAIPVAAGADPQPKLPMDWQIQYRRHPAAVYNRTLKPVKESAVELIAKLARDHDGLTIIALGPLTNVARLLKEEPTAAKRIKRIVLMGGSIAVGYDGEPKPEPEWNIKTDIPAAKAVFASGIPLTVVPLDATVNVKLDKDRREHLFAAHTPLTFQLQNLYELWDKSTPTLFDPVAVATAFDERFLKFKDLRLMVADDGMMVPQVGKPNARVATAIDADGFIDWYVERVRSVGKEILPEPPKNLARLVEPGAFPGKVHAVEDYEADIEKRWWMCGKLETKDVPVKNGRSCRAVLTQDFDDKQGQLGTMYRAVIFNPVPGPPMGSNTRLRFKYKLTGTDMIRVQLFSLSNGFHRYLSVSELPEGQWKDACVDLTKLCRPDGTGGPLAADERIDDIQFYVDPRAELLIDDIVLFDAAGADEKRPFPKQVLFTGWFDAGKQGVEWPGDFEIVNHEKPRTWKAARSVANPDGGEWLRVGLRGSRKLGAHTSLTFKYHMTTTDPVRVELREGKAIRSKPVSWMPTKANAWGEETLIFPQVGTSVDEIRFMLPKGSKLTIDDLLLYVPGDWPE
jgi:inosine-uridine nucleoside N-ribohydrolase